MDTLKRDHQKDKDGMDEHVSKVKDEVRQLKGERNTLELKCHEHEAVSILPSLHTPYEILHNISLQSIINRSRDRFCH